MSVPSHERIVELKAEVGKTLELLARQEAFHDRFMEGGAGAGTTKQKGLQEKTGPKEIVL
ncbi:MAG: hypothetical protein JXR77_08940 [Lentisphaeria bacterium]|nr:hypothetical protein [Lentisphaeria bacterium]